MDDGGRCIWVFAWCGGAGNGDDELVDETDKSVVVMVFGCEASLVGGCETGVVDLLLVASRGDGELADNVLREFVSGIMVARRLWSRNDCGR